MRLVMGFARVTIRPIKSRFRGLDDLQDKWLGCFNRSIRPDFWQSTYCGHVSAPYCTIRVTTLPHFRLPNASMMRNILRTVACWKMKRQWLAWFAVYHGMLLPMSLKDWSFDLLEKLCINSHLTLATCILSGQSQVFACITAVSDASTKPPLTKICKNSDYCTFSTGFPPQQLHMSWA